MRRLAHFSAVLLFHPAGNDGAEVGAPPAGDTPPPPPPPSPGSDIAPGGIPAPDLAELDRLANEGGPHSAPDDAQAPPPGPVSAIPERTPAEARAQHVAALEEHVRESATDELQTVFQTVKAELTKRESLPTATGVIVPNPHEVTAPDPATRPIVDDSIRPLDLDYSIAHLQALWGRDVSDLSSDEKGNVSKIIGDLRALANAAEAKYL